MASVTEIYRLTRKESDFFMNAYFYRPLASGLVWALAGTPVTPNQVTLCSFALAALGCVILGFWAGYLGLLVGVTTVALSYVLDCVDGMLARLKHLQSTTGHLLDFLMDELKSFGLLAVVAYRLWAGSGDERYLLGGLWGLVVLATGTAVTTFERRPEVAGDTLPQPGGVSPEPSLLRRVTRLPRAALQLVIHYPSYILVVGLVGHIELYFFPYVAVMSLYALRCVAFLMLRFGRP